MKGQELYFQTIKHAIMIQIYVDIYYKKKKLIFRIFDGNEIVEKK